MSDKNPQAVCVIRAEKMWAMKRESQARDRELIASGAVSSGRFLFIRPDMLRGAKFVWPEGSLLDEAPKSSEGTSVEDYAHVRRGEGNP